MTTRVTQTSTALDEAERDHSGAYICVSIEGQRLHARGARFELDASTETLIGNGPTRRRVPGTPSRIELPDDKVSRAHCRLSRRFGQWTVLDLESKNGTHVNGKGQPTAPLSDGDIIRVGNVVLVFRETFPAGCGDLDLESNTDPPGLVALAPQLAERFRRAATVAQADIPMLLLGPTGSGKELLTAAIHAELGRRGQLVPVNCGGLPAELVESELFGHRRGAFSGSHDDHRGLFSQADGGTLFLDEVGELPFPVQSKLLRAVQQRSIRPVGATTAEPVDVRLIAATNRDLAVMVAEQRFRADLYQRLAGAVIELPPVIARKEDFGAFLAHALRSDAPHAKISGRVLDDVMAHPWPGGARAMAHAVRAAAALHGDRPIREIVLPSVAAPTRPAAPPDATQPRQSPQDAALRDKLAAVCRDSGGNLAEVARRMGKDRKQIRRWIERLGLGETVEELRNAR